MAEWMLSSISRMVDRLRSLLSQVSSTSTSQLEQYSRVMDDIEYLKRMWTRILATLEDVDEREIEEAAINLWVRELRDLAFNIEELIDYYDYEKHRILVLSEMLCNTDNEDQDTPSSNKRSRTSEVSTSTPHSYNSDSTYLLLELGSRIRTIRDRFDEIALHRKVLRISDSDGNRSVRFNQHQLPSSSIINEPYVIGRDVERKRIMDFLLFPSPRNDENSGVDVIAVVGMGGVGKTTLAQLVYNDPVVVEHFDITGWVFASEKFDLVKLTKESFESLNLKTTYFTALSPLQDLLRSELGKKKFLLVLDDIWNDSQYVWDIFKAPFKYSSHGSTIIITTRVEKAAMAMKPLKIYRLQPLSDDDCWKLLHRHAFCEVNSSASPNLEGIAKDIAKKCRGLPLAVKAIGGTMRHKTSEDNWKEILESHLWDIEIAGNQILAILKLSYNHLPVHLKLCFLYLSVYPKSYQFGRREIVWLWMAQSMIRGRAEQRKEDVGNEYVDELLWSSLILTVQSSFPKLTKFVVHDLLHDLAQYILRTESGQEQESLKVSHSALLRDKLQLYHCHWAPKYEPRVGRTFLISWYHGYNKFVHMDLGNLEQHLKFIRVLDLGDTHIIELPKTIGNLKYLCYFSLCKTFIKKLPDSVACLYNMQTLDLSHCGNSYKLPKGMGQLKSLRHLLIENGVLLPTGFGRLTNLQTLNHFSISARNDYCGIEGLSNLNELRGNLCISGLHNVTTPDEATNANLDKKIFLQKVELDWSTSEIGVEIESQNQDLLIEKLRPNFELKELILRGYEGAVFPSWLSDPSFIKIARLELINCTKSEVMPALGLLPSLKHIHVSGLSSLRCVGLEFFGYRPKNAFISLEELSIEDMISWVQWHLTENCLFPRLTHLILHNCCALSCNFLTAPLPLFKEQSPLLQNVKISSCPDLTDWCIRHAYAGLAHIRNFVVDGITFHYPRQGEMELVSDSSSGNECSDSEMA